MVNGVFFGILKYYILVNNVIIKKFVKFGCILLVKLVNGVLLVIFMYNGGNVWVYFNGGDYYV